MVAGVPADVLALIEFVVVLHVLLHGLADGVVLVVVHDVGVRDVLGVDAAASLDHRKLLGVEVLVRVRGKASTHWLLVVLLVVAARGQVRQLLLGLAELLVVLLLIGVDSLDLVGASDLDLCSVAAHVVRMLAVLGQAVCESGPDTGLGKRARILLFEHVLLLSELFEPRMLQGLTSCDSVIRIVDKKLDDQVLNICASMRNQLYYSGSFHGRKIELHMRCIFLKVVQESLFRAAQDIVNFVNLVNFIISWEKWK